MRRRLSQPRGFTLLELILVGVIIATAMAIAATSLRGFWSGSRTRHAVSDILSATQWGRAKAIQEAMTYRMVIDGPGGRFWFERLEGEEFLRIESPYDTSEPLPEWLTLQLKRPAGQDFIEFFPSGRTQAAVISLMEKDGSERQIACASPAEMFRVLRPEELVR